MHASLIDTVWILLVPLAAMLMYLHRQRIIRKHMEEVAAAELGMSLDDLIRANAYGIAPRLTKADDNTMLARLTRSYKRRSRGWRAYVRKTRRTVVSSSRNPLVRHDLAGRIAGPALAALSALLPFGALRGHTVDLRGYSTLTDDWKWSDMGTANLVEFLVFLALAAVLLAVRGAAGAALGTASAACAAVCLARATSYRFLVESLGGGCFLLWASVILLAACGIIGILQAVALRKEMGSAAGSAGQGPPRRRATAREKGRRCRPRTTARLKARRDGAPPGAQRAPARGAAALPGTRAAAGPATPV